MAGGSGGAGGAGGARGGHGAISVPGLDEVAADLERIAERLSESAMDVLRAALSDGTEEAASRAKATERLVNRARSAVEKAARLTRQVSAGGDGSDESDGSDGSDGSYGSGEDASGGGWVERSV